MKAILLEENGSYDKLLKKDIEKPSLKSGEVLIRIEATSVNKVDTVLRKGYPGLKMNFPHILGGDIAGTVTEITNDVDEFGVDDRVVVYPVILPEVQDPKYIGNEHVNDGWKYFGMHIDGSYREYISVPAENLVKIPSHVSFEEAAALPIAGLTAYHAIVGAGKLQKGDTFFMWGGSGGMGAIAVQIAKALGATVITTVGKDEKKQTILDLGADHVFNHHTDDVQAEVMKLAPKGVDVLIDYVGPATFDKSFNMLRKNGKLIFCGMITGREITLNIQLTYLRHLNIHGVYLGAPGEFKELVQLVADGKVKPLIHEVLPLEEAGKAHEMMDNGNLLGKIILKP